VQGRELDYRRHISGANVGALIEICRSGCGNGPGRRSRERPASSPGLLADLYRWIPLLAWACVDRPLAALPCCANLRELQRPGRDSAKTARTSGAEIMNARPTKGPGSRLKENPMIGSNFLRAMTHAVAFSSAPPLLYAAKGAVSPLRRPFTWQCNRIATSRSPASDSGERAPQRRCALRLLSNHQPINPTHYISANCRTSDSSGSLWTAAGIPIPTSIRRCHRARRRSFRAVRYRPAPDSVVAYPPGKSIAGRGGRQFAARLEECRE